MIRGETGGFFIPKRPEIFIQRVTISSLLKTSDMSDINDATEFHSMKNLSSMKYCAVR
jgi:hypothetical protein